jgi:tryptophan-rich sensory protein
VLNALWSVLFFGLRSPALALAEILVLWGVLAAFQRLLWREDRVAGALWAPYLLWVSFATGLNATLWWLNRG